MSEKEYVVVVKRGVDIDAFDAELAAETGDGPIPSRSVDIADPRLGSKRMTHWMLTDEEAQRLYTDPRVLSVEIPAKNIENAKMIRRAYQTGDFTKYTSNTSTAVNWGLRRCIAETNIYGSGTETSSTYEYAFDGTGVDVVIQDSGLQVDHPEFTDANGNSRVQQIDWYTESGLPGTQSANHYRDTNGHGTHCAGIVAGKTYGWAKNAHIYSQKLDGLEGTGDAGTGISMTDAFDCIRLWHAAKTNGRPTVVNMSWGWSSYLATDPTSGNYRGTAWTWGPDYSNDTLLWQGTGLVPRQDGVYRYIPLRLASVDVEIEDMIDAGIHVVIASGNDYYKIEEFGGTDYDNYVVYGGATYFYHRGASPHSTEAFIVGNIDDDAQNDGGDYKDKTANSSNRGPGITMWAPGTNIISTLSTPTDFGSIPYPRNSSFNVGLLSGTSMAAPQVAGVLAQYLQSIPDLTPAQLKAKVLADSKQVMYTTGQVDDWLSYGTSLYGSPTNVLFSRYGRQPIIYRNIGL